MEEFEYQEQLNLCIGRLKEELSDVSLDRLNDVTLAFVEDHSDWTVDYNKEEDTIYIEKEKFKNSPKQSQELMTGLLNAITTDKTTKKSGISFDGKMEAFNRGVTHQLANALIPEEEENLTDFECGVVANLFTSIVGRDTVYDAYFKKDGERVYSKLAKKLGGDYEYLDTMLSLSDLNMTTLKDKSHPSLLGYIQEGVSKKYIENNDLSLEQVKEFRDGLFTEAEYAPSDGVTRLLSCATCDCYVAKKQQEMEKQTSRVGRMDERRKNDLDAMFESEMGKRSTKRVTVRR